MKIIIGTSIVPTIIFIILFVELGILITLSPQFVYAQTAENEIIENALESVEKASTKGISEIKDSMSNATKSTDSNITSDESNLNHNQIEYKNYESNAIGVKFKIPSTWEIREYNSTKGCFWGETDPIFITKFNCIIRLDNMVLSQDFTEVLHPNDFEIIISKDSTSNHSLTDYLSLAYEDTKKQAIKNQADVSFINDKETTIQNNPAWQIEYSINSGTSQYKQMDIVTKVNNTFYGLVYLQMNPSDYSKYLPEFENFVKSIEFIPSIEPKPSFLK
jgi:hypothetical protein